MSEKLQSAAVGRSGTLLPRPLAELLLKQRHNTTRTVKELLPEKCEFRFFVDPATGPYFIHDISLSLSQFRLDDVGIGVNA